MVNKTKKTKPKKKLTKQEIREQVRKIYPEAAGASAFGGKDYFVP